MRLLRKIDRPIVLGAIFVLYLLGVACFAIFASRFLPQLIPAAVPSSTAIPLNSLSSSQVMRLGRGTINQIAYSPNGKTLAVATDVGLWLYGMDPADDGRFFPIDDWVEVISWSPDNQQIAMMTHESIQIRDADDGHIVRDFKGELSFFLYECIAWSPDGKYLVVCANETEAAGVAVLDALDGHVVHRLVHSRTSFVINTDEASSVSWSPDSKHLAVASADGVWIWSATGERLLGKLNGHAYVSQQQAVAWSPDGASIAFLAQEHEIQIWSIAGRDIVQKFEIPNVSFESLMWSPDSTLLAAGSGVFQTVEPSVTIWSVQDGQLLHTLKGYFFTVGNLSWSQNNQIATGGDSNSSIKIWSARDGALVRELGEHIHSIDDVAWSPNGKLLAVGAQDKRLWIWRVKDWHLLYVFGDSIGGNDVHVSWSPDSEQIAVQGYRSLQVYSIRKGTLQYTLPGQNDMGGDVSWSPDGTRIASVSGNLKIYAAANGALLARTTWDRDQDMRAVAWSPDSSELATGADAYAGSNAAPSFTGTVLIWNPATLQVVRRFTSEHMGTVRRLSWSPNGKMIASLSSDEKAAPFRNSVYDGLRIWGLNDGLKKQLLQEVDDPDTGAMSADAARWSPDGTRIAWGRFGEVWITHIKDGALLEKLGGHTATVNSVAWSPDAKQVAAASYDGTVLIWNLDKINDLQ